MPIKLPRLTWNLDAEPLGYPGLVFTFWLNPPLDVGAEEDQGFLKKPWDDPFFHNLSAVLDCVTIPDEYTGGDGDLVVEIDDAKALWDLQHDQGFDPQLVLWASGCYRAQRVERLQVAAKN